MHALFDLLGRKLTMVAMMNGGMIEDIAIIGGLIGVQFVYAGNAVLLSYLMSLGLESLTLVIFTSFATFLILLPLAFYYERLVHSSPSSSLSIYFLCFWDWITGIVILMMNFMVVCVSFCRYKWPTRVSFKLLIQLLLLSLGGWVNLMTNFSISFTLFHPPPLRFYFQFFF